MREQPSGQEINTPTVPATETGKEKYCNVNKNNELVISIIFQHIDMIIFVVPVHILEQMPANPSQRRTRSMVPKRTQTIEGQGTQNTMSLDDDDIPIVSFMNVKKRKSKKN
jgi:hypothetical protein